MTNAIGFLLFLLLLGIAAFLVLAALCAAFINRVRKELVDAPGSETSHQATVLDAFHSWSRLAPTGREVFFPQAPHANPVYEITFSGLLRHHDGKLGDAFNNTDWNGNFSKPVDRLRVNGAWLGWRQFEMLAANRCDHTYAIRLDHPGDRLTLAVERNSDWRGTITAHVTLLPAGTVGLSERRQREEAEQAAEKAQQDARTKIEAASNEFSRQIQAVCTRAQLFRNWENEEYRRKFAEVHYDELIRNQSEIRDEAMKFLSQHALINYLGRHHPEVIRRFSGRLEALFLAETISLDKRLTARAAPPLPPPPPRKKLTAEEVRAIKIRKQRVQDEDRVELKMDKIATRLMIRERLENMALDPDEREMLEQELISEIDEGDADNARTI